SNSNTDNSPNGVLATNDDTVSLSSKISEPGEARVTCQVTRIDGEPDQPIDSDATTVKFYKKPTYAPLGASVQEGETLAITGTYTGKETANWKYTLLTPTLGTIDRTSIGN